MVKQTEIDVETSTIKLGDNSFAVIVSSHDEKDGFYELRGVSGPIPGSQEENTERVFKIWKGLMFMADQYPASLISIAMAIEAAIDGASPEEVTDKVLRDTGFKLDKTTPTKGSA